MAQLDVENIKYFKKPDNSTRVKPSQLRGKKPGRKTGTPAAGHGNYKTMPAKKLKKAAKKTMGKAMSRVARTGSRKKAMPTKAAKKTIGKAMSRVARTRSR